MIPPNSRRGVIPMASLLRGFVTIVLVSLLAGSSLVAVQTSPRSISDGVYTEQQAQRGQTIYRARCSSCHGDALGGRTGPPLSGQDFATGWSAQPLIELANKIRRTMPRDESARLTSQETADVLAYMLQVGKFPSGRAELPTDDAALKQVSFPAAPAAVKTPAAAGTLPSLPASGNLAQVMRGILFPSSNIVFSTQGIDPGAP